MWNKRPVSKVYSLKACEFGASGKVRAPIKKSINNWELFWSCRGIWRQSQKYTEPTENTCMTSLRFSPSAGFCLWLQQRRSFEKAVKKNIYISFPLHTITRVTLTWFVPFTPTMIPSRWSADVVGSDRGKKMFSLRGVKFFEKGTITTTIARG